MTREMAINILRGAVLGTNEQTHEAVFMAIKALKEQARVDAVEVVRCKDCKFYWKNSVMTNVPLCLASPRDDAFCSEGERGQDETG